MPQDPRKRQKKLEQKKAKRKAAKKDESRVKSAGLVGQLKDAAQHPLHECWMADTTFEQGMGGVMVSRKTPDGYIAFGVFLLDVYCLGVKDAHCGVVAPYEYSQKFAKHKLPYIPVPIEPAAARKIVESAVAFARSLGFSPHADYNKAKFIFGNINPDDCPDEFEFGQDGKPHFISGPYDGPSRCKQILNTLERTCGHGNYYFTLGGDEETILAHQETLQNLGNEEYEGGSEGDPESRF